MSNGTARKILAAFLAFAFPLSMAAADARGAFVNGTNGVSVNGESLQRAGAVFAGDRIEAPRNSAVSITAPGSRIVLPSGSALIYRPDAVALAKDSGVVVTTTHRMAVSIGVITIQPSSPASTRYEVARAHGQVLVAATNAPVSVFTGVSTLNVDAGTTASLPDPDRPQQGSAAPAASNAGTGSGGHSTLTLVGVAALVGATSAIITYEATKSSSSNSHP